MGQIIMQNGSRVNRAERLFYVFCSARVRVVQLNVSDGDHVIVGDVIRCSSNTIYPPVSYSWEQYVNESWHQLQQQNDVVVRDNDGSGSTLVLWTVGVYVLRCSGYNTRNFKYRYSATSQTVELRVVKTAGKCYVYTVKRCRRRNDIVSLKIRNSHDT